MSSEGEREKPDEATTRAPGVPAPAPEPDEIATGGPPPEGDLDELIAEEPPPVTRDFTSGARREAENPPSPGAA
jgi:hypothetical protein